LSTKPLPDRIELLNSIGVALSAEKEPHHLLERVLRGAKELTDADAGTLYVMTEAQSLKLEIVLNDSLGFFMGGTSGTEVPFDPIPLYDAKGQPNNSTVVVASVLSQKTIRIPDAYEATDFDFTGTRAFDKKTGYRSKSFLTVPMTNHKGRVIGVLQLLNAIDPRTGEVREFAPEDQHLAESLASQAAVIMTQKQLIDDLEKLFESFIFLIADAIDEKSPHTGGHCRRVPELTLMIADAATETDRGPLQMFTMQPEERYELQIASWLHDCGKITTPIHVVDKATKLETICDRIHTIDTRLAVMRQEAEIRMLKAKLAGEDEAQAEQQYAAELERLQEVRDFLHDANIGGEYMDEVKRAKVRELAKLTWHDCEGEQQPLLNDDELKNLCITKGTLNDEERRVINHHIDTTIKMLEALPFPEHLKQVPEFAGGHHERMDGKGYPRGLTRKELSLQARMMGIADIFEALTAPDRPYKKAMSLSQALGILGAMRLDGHIDPDIFDLFIRKKVYLDYARAFLSPEQIDEIDHATIPGYRPA